MKRRSTTAVALTVAGSDSGGGAGIQAELKTFRAHGVFGTSAITCITAQNPVRVSAVQPIDPRLVEEQMDRIFEAFPVGAAKTGMLYDAGIIDAVTLDGVKAVAKRLLDPDTLTILAVGRPAGMRTGSRFWADGRGQVANGVKAQGGL